MSKSKSKQTETDSVDLEKTLRERAENDGFTFLTESDGVRLYPVKEPGVTIRGILKGRFTRPAKKGEQTTHFYEIELTKGGVKCLQSELVEGQSAPEKSEVFAEPGAIVRVDETYILGEKLRGFVDNDGTTEVLLHYREKVKAGMGTVWRMDVAVRMVNTQDHEKAF